MITKGPIVGALVILLGAIATLAVLASALQLRATLSRKRDEIKGKIRNAARILIDVLPSDL
jgi:hypothetical protein